MRFSWLGALALALAFAAGCGGPAKEAGTAPSGEPTKIEGKLEVAAFKGGYGIDFYEAAAKEFAAKHPGLEVKVWGNPRVWEQLRPRFIGGDPPDLCFPGWGMDHWALVAEGQLEPLDEALAGKADDGKTIWRDTFEPAMLALGQSDGKQWVLPYYYSVLGWWYDPGVFEKNGWRTPQTYEELLALCEQIKAKGMAPITFQGKYPYYMVEGMLLPWCASAGGAEAVKAAQNLAPGAWKSAAMLKAAQMIDELNKKGFFQKGAVAMSHTESQQEFVQGRAAMIPCGTWLSSEMRDVTPPGAKMEFFLPPVLADGVGEKTSVLIAIEPWMVPKDAKNKTAAIALYKYMTSVQKARRFVEEKGTLMAIRGSDEGDLPDVLRAPAAAVKASKNVWAVQYRQWYPAFHTEVENALTALISGESDPQGFCERVEAAAEKARQDDTLPKHKVAG